MKKLTQLLIILVLVTNISIAQTKNFSIASGLNFNTAFGDNFLNKAYKNNPDLDLEVQFNRNNFFVGINYQSTSERIVDKDLIGDFSTSKGFTLHSYIGYKQSLKQKKMCFEHRIGIGIKNISNISELGNYSITGTLFTVGTRYNYSIIKKLGFYVGVDFNYAKYGVDLTGPYKDFYSNSYQIAPVIGLKYSFVNEKNRILLI